MAARRRERRACAGGWLPAAGRLPTLRARDPRRARRPGVVPLLAAPADRPHRACAARSARAWPRGPDPGRDGAGWAVARRAVAVGVSLPAVPPRATRSRVARSLA